jgi:uncharacterized membrane protein YbhN (UPF0104 family)
MDPASPKPRRTALRRLLGLACGVGLLAIGVVAARAVSWGPVLAQAARLPLPMLALSAGAAAVKALLQTTRLWTVFPRGRRPAWTRVARAHGLGQLTNACLPARVGDALKVVAMRDGDATAADATGAVLADRAMEAVTLVLLVVVLAPALLIAVFVGALHLGWAVGLAVVAAVAMIELLRRARPRLFAKLRRGLAAAWRGLRDPTTSRRLGVHLSLPQAISGVFVLNLGTALPVSVANVGSYEAALAVGLRAFGASLAQGIAIGVVHHAVQLVTIAAFALLFWVHDRLARRGALAVVTPGVPSTIVR